MVAARLTSPRLTVPPAVTSVAPVTLRSVSATSPASAAMVSGPFVSTRRALRSASATVIVAAAAETSSRSAAPVEAMDVTPDDRPEMVTPPVSTFMTCADTLLNAPLAPAEIVASANRASSTAMVVAVVRAVAPVTARSFAVRPAPCPVAVKSPLAVT